MPWIQRALAVATAAAIAVLAWRGWWPFTTTPKTIDDLREPSVWQYLFADRYVIGVLRLSVVAFALYVIVSVPALVAAARWAKGLSASFS
jgi:hypothetical protein